MPGIVSLLLRRFEPKVRRSAVSLMYLVSKYNQYSSHKDRLRRRRRNYEFIAHICSGWRTSCPRPPSNRLLARLRLTTAHRSIREISALGNDHNTITVTVICWTRYLDSILPGSNNKKMVFSSSAPPMMPSIIHSGLDTHKHKLFRCVWLRYMMMMIRLHGLSLTCTTNSCLYNATCTVYTDVCVWMWFAVAISWWNIVSNKTATHTRRYKLV